MKPPHDIVYVLNWLCWCSRAIYTRRLKRCGASGGAKLKESVSFSLRRPDEPSHRIKVVLFVDPETDVKAIKFEHPTGERSLKVTMIHRSKRDRYVRMGFSKK